MHKEFVVATFDSPDDLISAVRLMRAERFRIYDVHSPFPVHGLDEAMGVRRSRLPWATLLFGVAGLLVAIGFQFYANVLDWSLNVGGKPDNSTLAFVPITFELTVLFGGLGTVAALFLRARLFPGRREELAGLGVTHDHFAMVLRKRDQTFDISRAKMLLTEAGAERFEEMEADL